MRFFAQEGDPSDLLEVHPDRVIEGEGVDRLSVDHRVVCIVTLFEVSIDVADLDAHLPEHQEEALQLSGFSFGDGKALEDIVRCEVPLLLTPDDEDLSSLDDLVVGSPRRNRRSRVHSPRPPCLFCVAAERQRGVCDGRLCCEGPAGPADAASTDLGCSL
jgi:hypothetical protein